MIAIKPRTATRLIRAVALGMVIGFAPAPGIAESTPNGITVRDGWARASFGRAGAAYLTIENRGNNADQLVGVRTEAARRAMVHESVTRNAIVAMRHVATLDIAAGRTIRFQPGGRHIMLTGLRAALVKGAIFPLTLIFRDAGPVHIRVRVHAIASSGPGT